MVDIMNRRGASRMNRRDLLKLTGAAAGAALWPGWAGAEEQAPGRPGAFRFVHLADIHVQPEQRAGQGFRKCLETVHALRPRPDFILTGGDLVMDLLDVTETRARELFDLYTGICGESDIPIRQCIGNHDVFGWSSKGGIAPDHVSYGRRMVQERLGLDSTTYGFDHKGWHFAVVDDIQPLEPAGTGYVGGVSEADLDWLGRDLAAAGDRPKVVCSHIPFATAVIYHDKRPPGGKHIQVPTYLVCHNTSEVLAVLRERKVNLVLAGHLHQNETLRFDGLHFIGQGAVSGAWWRGSHLGNPEGFGVIDVRADGTFEHAYHTYGWQAKEGQS